MCCSVQDFPYLSRSNNTIQGNCGVYGGVVPKSLFNIELICFEVVVSLREENED